MITKPNLTTYILILKMISAFHLIGCSHTLLTKKRKRPGQIIYPENDISFDRMFPYSVNEKTYASSQNHF